MWRITLRRRPKEKCPPILHQLRFGNEALWQTLIFSLGSVINGGLVGVTGPSLHTLGQRTGLGTAALGRVVLTNRIAKLVGTFAWTAYAKLVQKQSAPIAPHVLLAQCAATIALCALIIATMRESALALQFALAISGAAYGVSDSAMTLLTVWANSDPTQQRFHVAMINVGFTVGALVLPSIIALAYHYGATCYLPSTLYAPRLALVDGFPLGDETRCQPRRR